MKPPPFDYVHPDTLDEALEVLARDEDARPLAGGQSLLPLLSLRLARPTVLVDLAGLVPDGFVVDDGHVTIGAQVTHRRLELAADLAEVGPLLAAAAAHIGSPAVRNRGTLGGSLAHADPAAELPAVAIALGADIVVGSPTGARTIAAADFFTGFWSTVLEPGEVVLGLRAVVPRERHGAAFCEVAPRHGDFATVGVGVAVELDVDRAIESTWIGACGVAPVPFDLGAAAEPLQGRPLDDDGLRAVARAVAASVRPMADRLGSTEDKQELAGLLTAQALRRAVAQAAAIGGPDEEPSWR